MYNYISHTHTPLETYCNNTSFGQVFKQQTKHSINQGQKATNCHIYWNIVLDMCM